MANLSVLVSVDKSHHRLAAIFVKLLSCQARHHLLRLVRVQVAVPIDVVSSDKLVHKLP